MATKRIRWDHAPIWGSLVWLLFATGCFGIRMEQRDWEPVRQSPVGVIVLVPEKRLEFSELLYRVLWVDYRETYYTFAGIWDPAPALGEPCTRTLQQDFGLRAVPLWSVAAPDTYRELVTTSEAALNADRRPARADLSGSAFRNEWRGTPPVRYLKAPPAADLRAAVRPLGVDFLLELAVTGITVGKNPNWPWNELFVFVFGRLIRLADGEVLWLSRQVGSSGALRIAELARGNLAPVREAYDKAVADLCRVEGIFADFQPNRPGERSGRLGAEDHPRRGR